MKAAQKKENERLVLVIQTICATGIRVSKLKFITVEAVQSGRAEISNKGKLRIGFLPEGLRKLLRKYIRNQKKDCRGSVYDKNREAVGSEQYLARYEEAV